MIQEVKRVYEVNLEELVAFHNLTLSMESCEVRLERASNYGVGNFTFVEVNGGIATIEVEIGGETNFVPTLAVDILEAVTDALNDDGQEDEI